MRHKRLNKKFGRSPEHREQLIRMLCAALVINDKITTTLKKAKQARKDAEKLVTLARKGTLAARRLVAARLRSPEATKRLFDVVVPALEGRNGGYTRITKIGARRGDAAEMCVLEFVSAAPAVEAAPATAEAAE
ncbi:MAG: 50S ribosomal protein L17 [Kiritimatiellae bacterium]|nr:50S ribosomal protein L17 [Kiritimatiellia bacterium]MBR4945542.1 50S ribosomal protein L17 [Kiritimatiellia bacterium]MBR5587274.1 50S ribosomal protein L17 [Kiritimatiellia bacterium]